MSLAEHLRTLEEVLLSREIRKNASLVSALLTDDFQEFGSSGRIFTREAIIASLQTESPDVELTLEDFEVSVLAEGVALATYRVIRSSPSEQSVDSLRSSVWILLDGDWRMTFHQGTRIVDTSVEQDGRE